MTTTEKITLVNIGRSCYIYHYSGFIDNGHIHIPSVSLCQPDESTSSIMELICVLKELTLTSYTVEPHALSETRTKKKIVAGPNSMA